MHNTDQINQFIEPRAQGLSVPKISEELGIPASTLYDWNHRGRERIQKLQRIMLDQVEERVLGAHEAQVQSLALCLKTAKGVSYLRLPELIRMAASLRRQLRSFKSQSDPDPIFLAPGLPVQPRPADSDLPADLKP